MLRSRALTGTLAGLAALILVDQAWRGRETLPPPPPPAPEVSRAVLPGRTAPGALARGAELPLLAADPAEVRAVIAAAGDAVYLPAMFAETDSSLRRWADSTAAELRIVFLLDTLEGWTPADREIARRALAEWEQLGIGVRFVEVLDSVGVHIVVRWVARFPFDRTGQADLEWDGTGRIRRATIQLALADQNGRPLSAEGRRAVALHEVGHALGLPHSDRGGDLMYPTTRRPELSPRDVATVRLLYRLPTISLKWSAPSSSP